MIGPIQSLMNMEMALYGGYGSNVNAPSYLNGYRAGNNYTSYTNPSFYGYNNGYNYYNNSNNATFGQTIPNGYGVVNPYQQNQQVANESVFQGLSNTETQALMEDYKKSLTPSEGFFACAATNAAFGLAMNPRLIVHPWNTAKATFFAENATNKFFNTIKNDAKFIELWKNPENSNILREAWLQHNKAVARCEGKFGAFRQSYKATGDVATIKREVEALEAAIKSGNMETITKQTARLQHVYSASNPGFIGRGINWCRNQIAKVIPESWTIMETSVKESVASKSKTVSEALANTPANTAAIDGKVAELAKTSGTLTETGKLAAKATTKTRFIDMLKRGGGVKGGLLFMGLEILMGVGKIKTAFEKDNETGMKQLGQTLVKGAGNAAGWAIGEAAALWAFTKAGAAIGTAFGPGIGTLIGGAVGLVGGGLGMWLAGKCTKALVGQDVADDIEAKKLAKSSEGQVQLLQNTMQRIQSGEKVSPEAQMAVQKLMTQMA